MRVIVTGGGGFLGRRLIAALQDAGTLDGVDGTTQPIDEIVVVDLEPVEIAGCRSVVGDVSANASLDHLFRDGPVSLFHLASMVSAASELDWEAAVQSNIGGLLGILGACRCAEVAPRVVFASSVAVFGGPLAAGTAGDTVKQSPRSTYGMTKAVGELLINDASRKGIIDGRVARLPTVVVRPGRPNAAASSFASSLFREPLQGLKAAVPVAGETRMVLISPPCAVAGLMAMHQLEAEVFQGDRAVGLPGLTVSVSEMLSVLEAVGGASARALASLEYDPAIDAVVSSWPADWDDRRARDLGLAGDHSLEAIVREFAASLG